jgi:2-oxoglutarate ferredoxin oxidoreductase subunit alpha
LWPLKTNKLIDFFAQNPNVHLVEGNVTGQLGQLIAQQTGLTFAGRLLKWNGRPFYFEEVLDYAQKNLDKKNKHV